MNEKETNLFYDEDAERQLIGSMLENNEIIPEIVDACGDDGGGFYSIPHQIIYDAIRSLSLQYDNLDTELISTYLKKKNLLNRIGGKEEIEGIFLSTPTWENYRYYIDIIKEKKFRRSLRVAGQKLTQLSSYQDEDEEVSAGDLLNRADTIFSQIHVHDREATSVGNIAQPIVEEISNRTERRMMYSTGIAGLDELTGGLHPSENFIIAARPSVGKSSIALQMAHWQSYYKHLPTLFASYEMRKEAIMLRLIAMETGIPFGKLYSDVLTDDEKRIVQSFTEKLNETPMHIIDKQLNVSELQSLVKYMVWKYGIVSVYIDFLQRMPPPQKGLKLYEAVTANSRGIKSIAMDNNITTITLSQLSRSSERRANPKPILADLRESGGIEEDADGISFLYRPSMYDDEFNDDPKTFLYLEKQRNGPTGVIELEFIGEKFMFKEVF